MELLELPEDHRQDGSTGPGGGADLEPAFELALGFLAEVREQLLLERDQPLRSAVEPQPGLGRLDPAAGAVEELLPDALFQRPDLQAHRRLRHSELVGGLREAAALDNPQKAASCFVSIRRTYSRRASPQDRPPLYDRARA
jgi:hypothetical protein